MGFKMEGKSPPSRLSPARSGKAHDRERVTTREPTSTTRAAPSSNIDGRLRYRVDAHVVDTQLKREHVVGLREPQTKWFLRRALPKERLRLS